jgi:hypothetical protein
MKANKMLVKHVYNRDRETSQRSTMDDGWEDGYQNVDQWMMLLSDLFEQ